MYKEFLKVKPSKTGGNGTFTTVQIPANIPIVEMTGPILTENELPVNVNFTSYLQVGPNVFMGLSGECDDYINHSCDPNCLVHVVGNRAIVYSLYIIPAGAELTFDYSTTSTLTLSQSKMNCSCGSFKCRKIISGFQYLDPTLQATYEKKGMVPLFVSNPNFYQKR